MKVLIALAVLLALGVGILYFWDNRLNDVPEEGPVMVNELATTTKTETNGATSTGNGASLGSTSAPSLGGSETTTLNIAMLDYDGVGQGSEQPVRGCDEVVFIQEVVPKTSIPLTVALKTLFGYEQSEVGGYDNFIARVNDNLSFERAEVVNGTAKIYLTGQLTGLAGVCDDPRAKIQIEETALKFDTVDRVELYLNGTKTELQPNGQGI